MEESAEASAPAQEPEKRVDETLAAVAPAVKKPLTLPVPSASDNPPRGEKGTQRSSRRDRQSSLDEPQSSYRGSGQASHRGGLGSHRGKSGKSGKSASSGGSSKRGAASQKTFVALVSHRETRPQASPRKRRTRFARTREAAGPRR